MKQVPVEKALRAAWALTKEHLGFLVAWLLLNWAVGFGLQYGLPDKALGMALGMVANVLMGLVTLLVYLRVLRGEPVGFGRLGELPLSPGMVLRYVAALLVLILAVGLGLLLLIVPGVYLMLRLQYVPLLILDRGLGLGEAFEESGRMTHGVKGDLLLLWLASMAVMVVGLLALCVGVLPAVLVVGLAHVWVYEDLSRQMKEGAQGALPTV